MSCKWNVSSRFFWEAPSPRLDWIVIRRRSRAWKNWSPCEISGPSHHFPRNTNQLNKKESVFQRCISALDVGILITVPRKAPSNSWWVQYSFMEYLSPSIYVNVKRNYFILASQIEQYSNSWIRICEIHNHKNALISTSRSLPDELCLLWVTCWYPHQVWKYPAEIQILFYSTAWYLAGNDDRLPKFRREISFSILLDAWKWQSNPVLWRELPRKND